MNDHLGINFEGLTPEGSDCVSVDITSVPQGEKLTLRLDKDGDFQDMDVVVLPAVQTPVARYFQGESLTALEAYTVDRGTLAAEWV